MEALTGVGAFFSMPSCLFALVSWLRGPHIGTNGGWVSAWCWPDNQLSQCIAVSLSTSRRVPSIYEEKSENNSLQKNIQPRSGARRSKKLRTSRCEFPSALGRDLKKRKLLPLGSKSRQNLSRSERHERRAGARSSQLSFKVSSP